MSGEDSVRDIITAAFEQPAAVAEKVVKPAGITPKRIIKSRSQDPANQPVASAHKVLKEFKPNYAETFKFTKIGASIRGILSRHKTITFEDGPRDLIVLHTRDGPRTVWLNTQLQSVIREAMDEGALKIGSELEIELIGYRQSVKDSRYCYEEYKLSLEDKN